MFGIGALQQIMAAERHLSDLTHLVSDLLISLLDPSRTFSAERREQALQGARDLLDFADRHAGKPQSDFELRCTTTDQIPPVRDIIRRITERGSVTGEEILQAQTFFLGISRGFSVRERGGCVNGLPASSFQIR